MAASLGWIRDEHVHFHTAPALDLEITKGYQNFDGVYVPVPDDPPVAAGRAAAAISAPDELARNI